ncbi:hypothetical protein [Sphingomonas pokkalii]|uniref:Uncharacterized protein n=1 Tax=Sphingomonas pokkalii TaxID=2175090 RepID=A0A2U0SEU5_9SPHN|nr:hypothetical protein [Sphingomonas pokkalii]PVX29902.1 hypothetical protein DD559_11635 [Sphingomonas pokkalii]
MPSDVDRLLARGEELIERSRARTEGALATRTRKRREAEILARLGRIAAADAVIILAAIVIGMFVPLGMFGALAVMALLILATFVFASLPVTSAPRVEQLVQVPLKALPATTERWLETQRLALPAPARTLVDSIGVKLETLAPQLARLDESSPAANEVRKLIGEQLPELVNGYGRVPAPLRAVPRNGLTPDQQLAQGLQVIDEEIAEMTAQLAQGDLDALATRGHFLQIKYKDDELG